VAAILDLARGIVHAAERHVRALAAQQDFREFELRVLVVEGQRRALQRAVGGFDIGVETRFRQAGAQIAGDGRQRFGGNRRLLFIVGIDVLQVVRELIEDAIGFRVVGIRAFVVGVDARQIELAGRRPAFGRRLQRRQRQFVIAAVIGGDALPQRIVGRAERDLAVGGGGRSRRNRYE